MTDWPKIIQGGMGAGVSSWRLARAVSARGQLGVVSGIALDVITVRRLQDGDADGSIRSSLEHFPIRLMAEKILERYFIPGGKPAGKPYATVPMHSKELKRDLAELSIVGNFVEVFLARQGHDGAIGINYLEKIQLPLLPSIYGAMLAGVAFVLMGAGIATKIPGVLDRLSNHQIASYELTVSGATDGDATTLSFDPQEFIGGIPAPLVRPQFLSIVSSNVLATTMMRRSNGRVDGFIIEGPTAGGHNAPPRGKLQLNEEGQPVYGEKDAVDLARIAELGLPFWLAGGYATPARLAEALASGACGVQVGTAFALCDESGLMEDYRRTLLQKSVTGGATIFTDPLASPTGFPFKIALLEESLSEAAVYEARERVCDLGFLRQAYRSPDGSVRYRCPSEPVDAYLAKGGTIEETIGRKCLCNALIANIGHPQRRSDGRIEPPLVTAGDDLQSIARFIPPGHSSYTARDVIDHLLGEPFGSIPA